LAGVLGAEDVLANLHLHDNDDLIGEQDSIDAAAEPVQWVFQEHGPRRGARQLDEKVADLLLQQWKGNALGLDLLGKLGGVAIVGVGLVKPANQGIRFSGEQVW